MWPRLAIRPQHSLPTTQYPLDKSLNQRCTIQSSIGACHMKCYSQIQANFVGSELAETRRKKY